MKVKTCCVTGHRDMPCEEIGSIKKALHKEIKKAVKDGFTPIQGSCEGTKSQRTNKCFAECLY